MTQSASSIFDLIAPQYSSDASKNDFIVLARTRVSACFYNDNYEQAVALMAAHMMAMRDISESSGASGGEIASKREGDLAISYHKSTGGGSESTDEDLKKTNFGIQLIGLRDGSGAYVGVTGGNDDGCYP